jgi:quercetin dioxygenase-like cupin family protein
MLIVRGDAQTLPSELNKAATGEVWFDPILPTTDGVDVGTVVFSPSGRTVWHQHEYG